MREERVGGFPFLSPSAASCCDRGIVCAHHHHHYTVHYTSDTLLPSDWGGWGGAFFLLRREDMGGLFYPVLNYFFKDCFRVPLILYIVFQFFAKPISE